MGLWFMTGARCKTPGCANEDPPTSIDEIAPEDRVTLRMD
jgi:hypothetical protein